MSHGPWFNEMVRNEQQDEEYRAEVKAERESFVRETCPNPSCFGGDVIVPDGSGFSALAICGICNGHGYIVTERKS